MSLSSLGPPVAKTSLAEHLAGRIQSFILSGTYAPGQRLPSIAAMAQQFGVGHPTLREAIKKLETIGLISVRHGAGVYVKATEAPLFLSNPGVTAAPSKKLLLDLIDARLPVETTTSSLAARNATPEDLADLHTVLDTAGRLLDDPAMLTTVNMSFHEALARSSGNIVLAQLVGQMTRLFRREQRVILDIFGLRDRDHREHLAILEAVEQRDEGLARERMAAHLDGVRRAIEQWDGETPAVPSRA